MASWEVMEDDEEGLRVRSTLCIRLVERFTIGGRWFETGCTTSRLMEGLGGIRGGALP